MKAGFPWRIVVLLGVWSVSGLVALSAQVESEEGPKKKVFPPGFEPPTATDAHARALIAAYWKECGGEENAAAAWQGTRLGTVRDAGIDWQVTVEEMTPQNWRVDWTRMVEGREHRDTKVVQAESGWQQVTQEKTQAPESLAMPERQRLLDERERARCLIAYEEKGHHFAFRGKTRVRGRSAYLLQGRLQSGQDVFLSFDVATLLLTRIAYDEQLAGQPVELDLYVTGYEKVGRALVPSSWETVGGGNVLQTMVWTSFQPDREALAQRLTRPETREFWLRQEDTAASQDPR